MASPREEWEKRISHLLTESKQHQTPYHAEIGGFRLDIHPSVYSPKYFPETLWYGQHLPAIVQGKSFLEVGVGSGLVSLHLAASGSRVVAVDVNPHAVHHARENFARNQQSGDFFVSDIFENVGGTFDFIFWNHPWQSSEAVPDELKSEKTFDAGYALLKRYFAEGGKYLNPDGSILLGTSCFADMDSIGSLIADNGCSYKIREKGLGDLGQGVTEEYYILQIFFPRP